MGIVPEKPATKNSISFILKFVICFYFSVKIAAKLHFGKFPVAFHVRFFPKIPKQSLLGNSPIFVFENVMGAETVPLFSVF